MNIVYVLKRVAKMDYKNMIASAKKVHQRSGKPTVSAFADMIKCGLRYGAGYMDYLVFEFEKLDDKTRSSYITRGVNNSYVAKLNHPDGRKIFSDKREFNRTFARFLHREWVPLIDTEQGLAEFEAFLQDKDKIVAKVADSMCGKGIKMVQLSPDGKAKQLLSDLIADGYQLAEEYIIQNQKIKAIYPKSVNTLRVVTITTDQPHVVFACLRVGNGSEVDNLNSGGMSARVNLETGTIEKPAVDKHLNIYQQHPMTQTDFIGFTIPHYEQAIQLVKQAANVVANIGYVGWDIAFTDNGPLLIEGNEFPGHDIYQFQAQLDSNEGLKPLFDQYMK